MKKLIIFLILFSVRLFSQSTQIILDENFSDWENVNTVFTDPANDANGNIDFLKLGISNDNKFIYFLVQTNKEINLQSDNDILLCIDADNNPNTGFQVNGLGAELVYNFGNRRGTYYKNGSEQTVKQHDVGLISSPTVSSAIFELMFNKNAAVNGNLIFTNDTLNILLTEDKANPDYLPDAPGGINYSMTGNTYNPPEFSIAKKDTSLIRIMAYNVLKDGIFKDDRKEHFANIFNAVQPDIIGFEEVYHHTDEDLANIVKGFLPNSKLDFFGNSSSDVHVVSRYPVLQTTAIDGNAAFLIDLSSKYGKKMLFIVAHPPCCNKDDSRQKEIDHIMAFIRDSNLEEDSPIVIVGDMNFVGNSQQVKTLLSGDIINNNIYGEDFTPDWDGTNLDDSKPITTGYPATFTWYSASSSYSPGRLDYIVFTGSVMELKNSFALFTPGMPADTLSKYGLAENDVLIASDHLPVVSDFKMNCSTKVSHFNSEKFSFALFDNYPNPFGNSSLSKSKTTYISFILPAGLQTRPTLEIYNMLGQIIYRKEIQPYAGNHLLEFTPRNISSGVYFYRVKSNLPGQNSVVKKMVYLK